MGFNDGCPKPRSGQDCSKDGSGPYCDHEDANAQLNKANCIVQAEKNCESKLQDALNKCSKESADREDYWKDKIRPQNKNETPLDDAHAEDRFALQFHDCLELAYRAASIGCSYVQCYCNQKVCKQPCVPPFCAPGGYGGGGGSKPPLPPATYKNESNAVNPAQFQTQSAYDIPIELVYSRAYLPGNLIYTSEPEIKQTVRKTTVYDSASNTYTTTTDTAVSNYLSFAFGLCAGEIDALSRLWINQALVYDRSGASNVVQDTLGNSIVEFYQGSSNQKVNQRQTTQFGFGKVPAYRDMSYVQVSQFSITELTSFPQINAEVVRVTSQDNQQVVSDILSDTAVARLFKIDPATKRVWIAQNDSVLALDYDNLEVVTTESGTNAINISAAGKIITYDGVNLGIVDPHFGQTYATRTADLSIAKSLVTRIFNNNDSSYNALISISSAGDIDIDYYDDTRDSFISSIDTLNVGGSVPVTAVMQSLERVSGSSTFIDYSLILPRINDTGDAINVIEFTMGTTDTAFAALFETGAYATYDIDNSYFLNATDLSLVGAIACDQDSSIIFITNTGARTVAQKWTKQEVVWSVDIPRVTLLGTEPMFREPSTKFCYMAADGKVYALNFADGATTVVMTTPHTVAGAQLYDPETDTLTFWSSDATVIRLFLNRVNSDKQSLGEVLRDVLARTGVDNLAVNAADSTILVTGYRTGSKTKGVDIIQELIELYPSNVFDAEALYVLDKGSQSTITVDVSKAEENLSYASDRSVGDTGSATLEYYSDPLFGERVTQSFILPTERSTNYAVISDSFSAIESDSYMRRLAELKVFSAQDGDVTTQANLPWGFLALTAGDYVKFLREFAISQITLGADNSLELKCVSDQRGKYQEVVALSSVDPIGLSLLGTHSDIAMSAPFGFIARAIEPKDLHSSGLYVGATDLWQEFSPLQVTETASATSDTPGGTTKLIPNSATWGRLISAPPNLGTAHWRTFPEQSFIVQFATTDMAQRVVESARAAASVDYGYNFLLRSAWTNLIMVGREFIQYKTASLVDSKTVMFGNLLRARANTEDFGVHEISELCVVVNKTDYRISEFTPADLNESAMLMSFTADGRTRRDDIQLALADVLPLQQNAIARRDVPAQVDKSSSHPENPHVLIRYNYRVQNDNVLTPTRSSIDIPGNVTLCYLLRGEYDEALFESLRDNELDFSYVMARGQFSDAEIAMTELPNEIITHFFLWEAHEQDAAAWTPSERLTAVVIEQSPQGFENHTITTWPANGDYARYTRGLS